MAEIKRTGSGQSFLNRPIGVVNVRTGAEKVHEARAREFAQMSSFAFDLAKEQQITAGREYGRTIAVRNENGDLEFPSLPASLGRYGQQQADEIMQRRYMEAATNDFRAFADEQALRIKDPGEYRQVISEYVKQNSGQMERSGGGGVVPGYTESAFAYADQQANRLALRQYNLREEQARSQARKAHQGMTSEIRSLRREGTPDALEEAERLEKIFRQELDNSIFLQNFSQEYVTDRNRELDGVKVTSDFQGAVKQLSLVEAEELQVALISGIDPKNYRAKYPKLFKEHDNLPEQVLNSVSSEINSTMTRLKSLYGASQKEQNAKNWVMNGAFGSGSTERGYTDNIISNEFNVDISSFGNLTQSGILKSPEFNNITKRLGALPTVMHDAVEAYAHGASIEGIPDLNVLNDLTKATLNAITSETGQINQKALSDDAVAYLIAVDEHIRAKGQSEQSLQYAFQQIPQLLNNESELTVSVARQLEVKKPGNKDGLDLAREDLMDHFKDWNPASYNQYSSVYALLLTQTSKDVAREKVKNLYNGTYQEYGYHFPVYGGGVNKFRYTPKYYYSSPNDHIEFIEQIQNLGSVAYKKAGGEVKKPVLGTHFFIKSSPFNDHRYGEFMIVDENGKAFLNDAMAVVMINTNTVTTAQTNAEKQAEEAANTKRIAEMLDRFDELPSEFGKPFAEGGPPLMGR